MQAIFALVVARGLEHTDVFACTLFARAYLFCTFRSSATVPHQFRCSICRITEMSIWFAQAISHETRITHITRSTEDQHNNNICNKQTENPPAAPAFATHKKEGPLAVVDPLAGDGVITSGGFTVAAVPVGITSGDFTRIVAGRVGVARRFATLALVALLGVDPRMQPYLVIINDK